MVSGLAVASVIKKLVTSEAGIVAASVFSVTGLVLLGVQDSGTVEPIAARNQQVARDVVGDSECRC